MNDLIVSVRAFVRTLRFLYDRERWRILWAAGAGATGLYVASTAWLSKRVVDTIATPQPEIVPGIANAALFAGAYGLATLAHSYITSVYTIRLLTIRDRIAAAADQLLMEATARVPEITHLLTASGRDSVRLASAGGRALPNCLPLSVDGLQHLMTLAGVSIIVGYYHPLLIPLVCLPSLPLFRSQARLSGDTFAALVNQSPAYRRMRYCIETMLGTAAAKETRVYRTGGFFLDEYRRAADQVFAVSRARRAKAAAAAAGWGTLSAAGIGGGFVYVVYLATQGGLTLGGVVMYTTAVAYAGSAVRGLSQAISALVTNALQTKAFFDYVDARTAEAARAHGTMAVTDQSQRPEWRLDNVSFTYPGQATPALDGVSLEIRAREKIAIVGANGAGKSTLMMLMLGLLVPSRGQIAFRGVPLPLWQIDEFRKACAAVFQDFVRFKLTLRENIAIAIDGVNEAAADERVAKAAAWAGIDDIARSAPDGYATQLGREFSDGIDLSLGQWHRLALARGFARDAAVLFIDEPSASLDAPTEHALFERLLSLADHRTAVVISHRLSITPLVDRIVVLDHGRIIEQGTHVELMRYDGPYAAMYTTQAGLYWPEWRSAKHQRMTNAS